MKLIFFGSDEFAIPSLKAIANSSHKILAVVTQPDKPAGRGKKLTATPTALEAERLGLNILKPDSLAKFPLPTADILVVVAYGKFLPQKLIESVPHQAVNLHPSLLPKYRGASPIQTAILNGDAITGVSTTTITPEMDAGDIYNQIETKIGAEENAAELSERLATMGADLLVKTLDQIKTGRTKRTPQNPSLAVFTKKFEKSDGRIDWNEPAELIARKIRAFNPWPGAFCFFKDKRLKILKATCSQGALHILEVQLEGGRSMPMTEFLKGHPSFKIGDNH